MGLNGKDIQLRLFKVLHVSVETSYSFMKKHPFVSGALLIFFILYIFLSFIYNLLAFLSPFFVCAALFLRIFWSSEQNHLKIVKKEEEKGEEESFEPKISANMLRNERRGLLYKCPSHNATSRRRNFTGKKLDVYGGIEIKAKDLSSVFRNEFTKNNKEIRKSKFYKEEVESVETPTKRVMFSEPPKLVRFIGDAGCDGLEKKTEKKEDEKKVQEECKKGVELTDDEQKNVMDLGTFEMERHKRLESLIARRKARKQLKLQIEKGLIDMKSVTPSQIAPLFVTRLNPLDSPREIDGIEMPGSAPSALRSPFDIPYDPFEEKPNLTGDSFDQEFTKEMLLGYRQDDYETREHGMVHPRVRRLQVKGNYDKLEQLLAKKAMERTPKAPIPSSEGGEKTHEENGKCEIDKMAESTGEEVDNAQVTKSMSDHATEPDLVPEINIERGEEVSEKIEEPTLPISSTSATKINDSLYEALSSPGDKIMETVTGGKISHAPSCSMASDLQVEVSEIGSPTLTNEENHDTSTSTDGESIYDGDIDKDITSGSEDMWGASLHLRELRRVGEQDISELNSWRDLASPLSIQHLDDANAADVSSISSRSDLPDDTPTYATSNDHNIFGNMKDFMTENGAPQPSHSSVVTARWKRLMHLMDNRANHLPQGKHSEKPGELFNLLENSSKAQVTNEGNNSTPSDQDKTHSLRGNEEPGATDSPMQHETTDEISINSSSSSSPRSVLSISPKAIADQVASSPFNQEMHQDVQKSNMQNVAQEMLNGEGPLDSIAQNIQPSMDDPNVESHNSGLSHPQELNYPPENSIQESDMNIAEKLDTLIVRDASAEHPRQAEMMASDDISEESRELVKEKVPLISLILSSTENPIDMEEESQASMRQEATEEPCIDDETTDTSSDEGFEGKHGDLNENEATLSSCSSSEKSDKPKHSAEEVTYSHSESKQDVEDHNEKEKLDKGDISEDSPLPIVTDITNSENTEGECDKVNKNESTDKELNKNETTDIELNKNETIDKELDKNESTDNELNKNETTDKEFNKNETLDKELNKNESTDNELNKNETTDNELNKNESTDNELNKNETIDRELKKNETTDNELNKNETTDRELNKNESIDKEPNKNESTDRELNKNESIDKEPNKNETTDEEFSKNETTDRELNKNESIDKEPNKNETTDEELNKNETTDRELNKNESIDKEPNKNETTDEEFSKNETTDTELNKNESTDNELNKNETTDQELSKNETTDNELNKNETTDQELSKNETTDKELSKNETMAIAEGDTDEVRNIAHMKDPEEGTST